MSHFFVHNHERDIKRPTKIDTLSKSYPIPFCISLLAKSAGRVLTYDYIITELWGPYAVKDNQILRVNMANIRRKLEKNPASPEYIFTEVGIGYRMVDTP